MNYPFSATNDGTRQLVKTGLSDLEYLSVDNNDAAVRYLQIFDAAAISEVTLGTTDPTQSFKIAASATRELNPVRPWRFQRGIVIAVTTLRKGAVAVTTPADLNARVG